MVGTKREIDALAGADTPRRYRVAGAPGLYVVVQPSGAKSWVLVHRVNGKRLVYKLGSWPAQGVDQARKLALSTLGKLERHEPVRAVETPKHGTVGELRHEYVAWLVGRGAKSARSIELGLGTLFGTLDSTAARTLTRGLVVEILTPHWQTGHLARAQQLLSWARAMFSWAIASEAVVGATTHRWGLETNPAMGVSLQGYAPQPANVLWTPAEIASVWHGAMDRSGPVVGLALRACIAAGGQRVQEIVGIKWSDYDQERGTLTFATTKMGRPHTIVVGRHLAGVLADISAFTGGGEYVFASGRDQPPHFTSLSRAVRRIRGPGSEIAPRYLRATAKTLMVDRGVDRQYLDLWQNHKLPGVSAVASKHYDKSKNLDVKAIVAAAWDGILDGIL